MPGYQIHIEGQVQGVGFRPHVYRIAKRLGLTGWVKNGNDGVHIFVNGDESVCRVFLRELFEQPPAHARIVRQNVELVEKTNGFDFQIEESDDKGEVNVLLTPDLGLCGECREEIKDEFNRRKEYAFTTCIHCGPRYSIIQSLPYDRVNTSMSDFEMCTRCAHEYENPHSRRYYSQTNSCPQCGVSLSLMDNKGNSISNLTSEILDVADESLRQGKILAVKGIGGFLLMADAENESAVELLRERKHRPTKPFALLYPSLAQVEEDVFISTKEKEELTSIVSPIVLLKLKGSPKTKLALTQIAPSLSKIGVMLPYTPLLELIAGKFGKPLIATSGNISGSPIFYLDDQAFKHLENIADLFLTNNRDIVVPQDDSVVQFAGHQKIVLRRSRGLAPTYLPNPFESAGKPILATGSDLKSAFALLAKDNLYVSQYLGDLENFETQQTYYHVLHHFQNLFKTRPSEILVDAHPSYFSSKFGQAMAAEWEVPVTEVQHHLAHFSAVLAENDLLKSQAPVLGVIWDGTGWGDDGNIWGGEFFRFEDNGFKRIAHLDYFDHMLGDKLSREPRLSALSLCDRISGADELLKPKFNSNEWKIYKQLLKKPGNFKTSSIGRLFDGVASLLGICDNSTFEGEAALRLETLAAKGKYQRKEIKPKRFSLAGYLQNLINEIKSGMPAETLAYEFHVALVGWIDEIAEQEQVSSIAFSGGVFQNAVLNELIGEKLGKHRVLYFHRQLSCNDECIGFGQLAYRQIQQHAKIETIESELTETV